MLFFMVLVSGQCVSLREEVIKLGSGWTAIDSGVVKQFDPESEQIKINVQGDCVKRLFICSRDPTVVPFESNQILDFDYGCVYPINLINEKTMIISQNLFPKHLGRFFQVYTGSMEETIFISVLTDHECEANLTVTSGSKGDCLLECKNGGTCRNSLCQCPMDFVGSDCSVKLHEYREDDELVERQYYFLNLDDQVSSYELGRQRSYRMMCYESQPIFTRYVTYESDTIALDALMRNDCRLSAQSLSDYANIHVFPHYILFLNNLEQLKPEDSSYTMVILGVCLGVGVLTLLTYCGYLLYRQHIIRGLQKKKELQIVQMLDKYMATIRFQQLVLQGLIQDQEELECAICLQVFHADDIIRGTYCKHYYHDKCIQVWLLGNTTCPMCRSDLAQSMLEQRAASSQGSQPRIEAELHLHSPPPNLSAQPPLEPHSIHQP